MHKFFVMFLKTLIDLLDDLAASDHPSWDS